MMTNRRARRDGYAMVLVVLFLVLFLGLWGRAARQVGSLIRIERGRAQRVLRDRDRLPAAKALAKALAALEVGYPPSSSFTYKCKYQVYSNAFYLISFVQNSMDLDEWTVTVRPLDPSSGDSIPDLDTSQFTVPRPSS